MTYGTRPYGDSGFGFGTAQVPGMCPITPKYSGDTVTINATPKDGIGPYYVVFSKDGVIIDPSRLGGLDNPIINAPENTLIIRIYILDDEDIRISGGTIYFSVFISDSCPTGAKSCTDSSYCDRWNYIYWKLCRNQ
jgi:hypothetical protein